MRIISIYLCHRHMWGRFYYMKDFRFYHMEICKTETKDIPRRNRKRQEAPHRDRRKMVYLLNKFIYMLTKYVLKWNYTLEKQFQTDYLKALRNDWYVTYRIQDVGLWYRFLDSFAIDPWGVTTFIEFKIIDNQTFNVSHFEMSQIKLLHDLDLRNMDTATVAIWSKKFNTYRLLNFSEIWNWKNDKW